MLSIIIDDKPYPLLELISALFSYKTQIIIVERAIICRIFDDKDCFHFVTADKICFESKWFLVCCTRASRQSILSHIIEYVVVRYLQ